VGDIQKSEFFLGGRQPVGAWNVFCSGNQFFASKFPFSSVFGLIRYVAWEYQAPRLAEWLEKNLAEGLTVFSFPSHHQRKLRTSNVLERLNQEIKRRTRVARVFPNDASCLRLISALLMETSETWQTGHRYLRMEEEELMSPS
jgi:hypothetical protein